MNSKFFVNSMAMIFLINFAQKTQARTESAALLMAAPSMRTQTVKSVSCNPTQKLSFEYQTCLAQLNVWKNKKKVVVEDNSELIQSLKIEINTLFEANSDMEADYEAELQVLTQQLETLKRKKLSLQTTHEELKMQVKNLVNTNNDLKRESDLYLSKNKQIRTSMEIIEKNNLTLKTTCNQDDDDTIIIGSEYDNNRFT